ncbi:MAG TPA: hypothetical protein VIL43_06475 [Burkholderiales bacterium]
MSAHPDRQADLALLWAAASIVVVVLGAFAIRAASGWEAIALYFLRLFSVGLIALVPIVLAALALTRGTAKREKAILAVLVSAIAFVAAIIFNAPAG